jgi:octaprenyl-diphosphate synthase
VILDEIRKPIAEELEKVENEFQLLVKSDVTLIDKIIDHIVTYKGKRLRPILLLLCSGLTGEITQNSIRAATIVELLHTATLIHDDVVDESELRRGGPSVNSLWNNKITILMGDYLFSTVLYGLSELNDLKMIDVISRVVKRMSQGELLQLENGHNYEMEESTYFRLISDKTASLLSATCELGAITSTTSNKEHYQNLRDFGEYLGIAFQIKDDLLDFTGNESTLGKPIAKDIIDNTITLPLLYGIKNSDNHHQTEILKLLETEIDEKDVDLICRFAEQSGGIEYATKKAEYFTNKALNCLEGYQDTAYKRSLTKLTKFITTREN